MSDETTKPQPQPGAPDPDGEFVALIDPENQIALAAVLACKRKIGELEAAQKIQQALLDSHEGRIEQLEALLLSRGSGTAN